MFLTVDESVLVSMVVEVNLSVQSIDLNKFLPVCCFIAGLVVLDEFELVGEASADDQFVLPTLVERPNLFCNHSLIVFVDGDAFYQTVHLFAFRKKVNAALFIEYRFLTLGASIGEFVLVND